jgi:outer membrane receptor protein involved in Fe transport
VLLLDATGQRVAGTSSDDQGRYRLEDVAPGTYQLRAHAAGLRSRPHRVEVRDGFGVALDLALSPELAEDVVVAAETPAPGGASGTTLAGETVRRRADTLRGNALRAAVADTPGWTAEDNGLMHFRGADDGVLFVIDGVPVYERLDPLFGIGMDPLALRSVRVLSGNVPAEFGLRSGGVVEVRSNGGTLRSWSGALETGVASHASAGLSGLAQGPLGEKASLTLGLAGERSQRLLDPVSEENLHNHGWRGGADAELVWSPGASVVSLRAGHARAEYDVPHDQEQESAGQDQLQLLRQSHATLNWQRASGATVSQLALFGRFTSGALDGGPSDTPLAAESDRRQDRLGVLGAATKETARHRVKLGFEASRVALDERLRFFVTDPEAAGVDFSDEVLEHDAGNPFDFSGNARRPIVSLYAQDSFRVTKALSLDVGLRFDHSRLLLSESQWSPRLGASWRVGRATLRGSLLRFFQPPQTEYLLLSSSPEAHRLSPFADQGGGAELPAERQTAFELGAEVFVGGGVRADLALWRREIRNQGDPNVFLSTTIVFPNSVERGLARGLDVRLELRKRRGVSGFLSYTLAKVDQYGPINGGLFLEDDVIEIGPGTRFTPDHDIRHAGSAELRFEHERHGFWVALSGRYRSGTPLEVSEDELDELAERPGADLVDFAEQRVKPYAVVDLRAGARLLSRRTFELFARGSLLNALDARYAFNFGNPFSGTHFGAPRGFAVDLGLTLR